jgi:hypothetical protein
LSFGRFPSRVTPPFRRPFGPVCAVILANFLTEGLAPMTGTLTLFWRITPASPPRPHRRCSTCGTDRPFHPSGKVRLNANGQRLDAWLIYKCDHCDTTWNLPLLERARASSVPPADLQAMQQSDPDWVQARAFDLAALGRHSHRIEPPGAAQIVGPGLPPGGWSILKLTLGAPVATGERLDRFLARVLHLPRSALPRMQRSGALILDPPAALNRQVAGTLTLRIVAARLTATERGALSADTGKI